MDERLRISRNMVLAFAAVALGGALLLMMPFSRQGSDPIPFVDALFTSVSAVCVTGLATFDISSRLSFPGQLILLGLIQAGGIGILTFSAFAFSFGGAKRKLGLDQRMLVQETAGGLPHIEPRALIRRLVGYTLMFELAGAAILALWFWTEMHSGRAIWYGLFHSISAFCNAGFSLFSNGLENYYADPVVSLTIMALIVAGGLGFTVAADLFHWGRGRRALVKPRLSLHTKTVLWTTFWLLCGGTALFFVLELNGHSFRGGIPDRILQAGFLSVTTRTAGFNTSPMATLTDPTLLLVIILMFIGASPGSTGGGIKTTTLAIFYALVRSRTLQRPKIELMKRSIPPDLVAKALATIASFLVIALAATVVLHMLEVGDLPHNVAGGKLLDHAFEVVSALGTVGLSVGITPTLTPGGKAVIILMMFVGRLGPLLLASSLIGAMRPVNYSYPEERVLVG